MVGARSGLTNKCFGLDNKQGIFILSRVLVSHISRGMVLIVATNAFLSVHIDECACVCVCVCVGGWVGGCGCVCLCTRSPTNLLRWTTP